MVYCVGAFEQRLPEVGQLFRSHYHGNGREEGDADDDDDDDPIGKLACGDQ